MSNTLMKEFTGKTVGELRDCDEFELIGMEQQEGELFLETGNRILFRSAADDYVEVNQDWRKLPDDTVLKTVHSLGGAAIFSAPDIDA